MADFIETLTEHAQECRQLLRDIELIRVFAYESDPPLKSVLELLNGSAALWDLRFDALFDAYSKALAERGPIHPDMEQCLMEWWGACEDMRCAAEGAQAGLLGLDALDNALLGISSLSLVRAARFMGMLAEARGDVPAASEVRAEPSVQN